MTTLLLIEENTDLAYGLTNNLAIEGYEVAVASTGEQGLERFRADAPDFLVLDLMLPDMDGFRVLRRLRD
jgi:DNA-binding response OmpR family regulator